MAKEKKEQITRKIATEISAPKSHLVTLRVILEDTVPPIWRQLQLSDDMTLDDLHFAIQGAFGWENDHLHMFILKGGEQYTGRQSSWDGDFDEGEAGDSREISLGSLIKAGHKKFRYEYDFGDSWMHEIKIEKVVLQDEKLNCPVCIDGELCGPPEDCGGIHGFQNFKEIMADRKHPEYREMKDWYGKVFKPEKFDIKEANKKISDNFKYSSLQQE